MQLSLRAREICKRAKYVCSSCFLKDVCLNNNYESEDIKIFEMNELANKYNKIISTTSNVAMDSYLKSEREFYAQKRKDTKIRKNNEKKAKIASINKALAKITNTTKKSTSSQKSKKKV